MNDCLDCEKSFDCVDPCDEMIGWVDLPDDCRDKGYTPKGHISGWGTEVDPNNRAKVFQPLKELNKPLDFD